MNAHVAQWIGSRARQEDAYAVRHFPEGVLAVVCDGMGGHHLGGMASRTAVSAFVEAFAGAPSVAAKKGEEAGAPQGADGTAARLYAALHAANHTVGEAFEEQETYGGTTLLATFAAPGALWWISVGDSPLFLWRRGKLIRLNADHSMRAIYAEYVDCGALTYEDAMNHGHVLRSAVTGADMPLIDAPPSPIPLLPGDRLLLTSDGTDGLLLHRVLPEKTRALLDTRDAPLAALVVEACRALGDPEADNVTVITLDA